MNVLPNTFVFVPVPDATAIWFDELQVSGTPVSVIPRLSVTVALSVVLVPVFIEIDVLELLAAAIEICCTGQVCTSEGWPLKPLAAAKIGSWPGILAVTISWLRGAVTGGELKFTIAEVPGLISCHENGPTLAVMSVEPFIAVA